MILDMEESVWNTKRMIHFIFLIVNSCPQITDLLVNITKHVLKPQHQLLTDEEKQRLLKKYSIEEKQVCTWETKLKC